MHCHAAEAITYADEEMPTGATADQAAATAAEDVLVGSDASPRPNAQPSKKKQSKSLSNPATCTHVLASPGLIQISLYMLVMFCDAVQPIGCALTVLVRPEMPKAALLVNHCGVRPVQSTVVL